MKNKNLFSKTFSLVSCDQISNLTSDMFDEKGKETVISRRSRNMLRDAAGEIDLLQREAIKDKSSIILLQHKAIEENKKDIKAVESTIQTEIKSYRDALSSQSDGLISSAGNEKERISIQDVKEAVKSVTEDDTRSKNLMIFGLKEEQELEISLNGDRRKTCGSSL